MITEDDYIVDIGTVAHEFVLFQPRADKAFLAVDVELLVGFRHFGGYDGVEVAYLGAAGELCSVFLFQAVEPGDGIVGKMS